MQKWMGKCSRYSDWWFWWWECVLVMWPSVCFCALLNRPSLFCFAVWVHGCFWCSNWVWTALKVPESALGVEKEIWASVSHTVWLLWLAVMSHLGRKVPSFHLGCLTRRGARKLPLLCLVHELLWVTSELSSFLLGQNDASFTIYHQKGKTRRWRCRRVFLLQKAERGKEQSQQCQVQRCLVMGKTAQPARFSSGRNASRSLQELCRLPKSVKHFALSLTYLVPLSK